MTADTRYASCTTEGTRDVVRHVHRTPEAAERCVDRWSRRLPANVLTKLMYTVREVPAGTAIGTRLRH